MALTLPAYLEAEGVRRIGDSEMAREEAAILGPERFVEMLELMAGAQRTGASRTSSYAFHAKHRVDHLFESDRYEETLLLTEKVNRRLQGRKTILDAGCFTGLKTIWYALQNPDCSVHGIDLAPEAIEAAERRKTKYAVPNLSFSVQDVLTLQPAKQYDAVVLTNIISIIEEVHTVERVDPEYEGFARGTVAPLAASLLNPHGLLIIYDKLNGAHLDEHTAITQAAMLSRGFSKAGSERLYSRGSDRRELKGVFLAFQKS